uniref:Uncharacterized protein n=1 Tax=Rhizophora mucronata TaxID=61149 RepID=A0A2P2QUE9_RHIMU
MLIIIIHDQAKCQSLSIIPSLEDLTKITFLFLTDLKVS